MNSARQFIAAIRKARETSKNFDRDWIFPDDSPEYLTAQREAADAFAQAYKDGFSLEDVVKDAAKATVTDATRKAAEDEVRKNLSDCDFEYDVAGIVEGVFRILGLTEATAPATA